MKSTIRTYCLLAHFLFTVCIFFETGANSVYAEAADSIANKGMKEATRINPAAKVPALVIPTVDTTTLLSDTAKTVKDTASVEVYKPNPKKAIWYSALCPGLGQLYNRRYWKLPIVGAGVAGIAYAIGWNSKYYNAYTNAYRDITDNDPNTKSYLNLLSGTGSFSESQLTTVLQNRQKSYRRYRDLSYIGAVGVYLICLIDAYVDAQLYDFDISPDLSFHTQPALPGFGGAKGFEINLAFHF